MGMAAMEAKPTFSTNSSLPSFMADPIVAYLRQAERHFTTRLDTWPLWH